MTTPQVPGIDAGLEAKFCGDAINGGMLRDMAFTVWNLCHNPSHEDGNADWFNDTLPVVNKAVEELRAALRSTPQPGVGDGEWGVGALEWVKSNAVERWTARHGFGVSEIIFDRRADEYGWFRGGTWVWLPSLIEAKAAAQSDFETRVKSCLTSIGVEAGK